jgi:hypothetical protein
VSAAPARAEGPAETTRVLPRLIKCALALDESRAYWERVNPDSGPPTAQQAFEAYWFGARSLSRVEELLANMRARFDAFPEALGVLRGWRGMTPECRAAICHWHVQLSDPLYRAFSGELLVARHHALRPEIRRGAVIAWLAERGPGHWTLPTRKELATRLLSTALSAGLLTGRRDPRHLVRPRIPDDALSYLLYLLRGVSFAGTLTENPYLRSVGLAGKSLEARLRALPALRYHRASDVAELGWRYPSLAAWAEAELRTERAAS